MNTKYNTAERQNTIFNEVDLEKTKVDIELSTEKIDYFENILSFADNLKRLTEAKILHTKSTNFVALSNKLDSQIQNVEELMRIIEIKRDESISKLTDAEVSQLLLKNRILIEKNKFLK